MPQRQRHGSPRVGPMRRSIASLAARLMAEDGVNDYGFAKRKAARQLGAPETEALPTNAEVEAELRAYQAIYQRDEMRDRLQRLRATAVALMRLLEPFTPYLTGSVLDGTAGRCAVIELAVFPDSAKAVELFLLDHGIDYHPGAPGRNDAAVAETVLNFDWRDAPVSLTVFNLLAQRSQQRSPYSGRAFERASRATVEALLEEPS